MTTVLRTSNCTIMDEESLMESSEYPLTLEPRLSVVPPVRSGVFVVPLHSPSSTHQHRSEDNELVAHDESLADLQPEDSDEDYDDRPRVLTQEQQVGGKNQYICTLIDAHY